MLKTEAVFHSGAPIAHVWDVYTAVDLWPRWSDDIAWADIDGPYRPGARGRMKFRGLPKASWMVISTDHPRAFVSEVDFRFARLTFEHELAPHAGGTRIVERVDFGGPLGLLVGLRERGRWRRRWPAAMGAMSEIAYERAYEDPGCAPAPDAAGAQAARP